MYDGDTLYALGTGTTTADINVVGTLAAKVTAEAIVNAVKNASSLFDIPSFKDIHHE